MRKTNFFIPILKETPAEAKVISHQLMLKSGMIRQLTSGIYNWLPLGRKLLLNIERIIRKNMDNSGASEILMSCIQPASLWRESGRYEDYGAEMLRIKDRHENDMLFGPTNEEVVSDIFRQNVQSYKNLPLNLYQMQWKFRDEIRPRFGVMRGREFYMKDAYSFDIDAEAAKKTYNKIFSTYLKIFSDLSLEAIAMRADSGPIGGDLSHEFHILAESGESLVYYDRDYKKTDSNDIEAVKKIFAVTEEKYDPDNLPIDLEKIEKKRGIEAGHIFYLGTKYSEALNIKLNIPNKGLQLVHMGCYGIGVSRLAAALIEVHHDDKGVKWPLSVAPFKVSLLNLDISNQVTCEISEKIYDILCKNNIDILYDDEENSPGNKFANHDLIGSPWQIIVGPRDASASLVEIKERATDKREKLSVDEVINKIIEICRNV